MKQKLFLLVLGLMIGVLTMAQAPQGQRGQNNPAERIKRQTENMTKDLGLNEAQSAEVAKINEKYGKMRAELFSQEQSDRQARWDKIKEINDQQNEALKKVLSADQYKKHIEVQEQRREDIKKRRTERQDAPQRGEQRGGQRGQ